MSHSYLSNIFLCWKSNKMGDQKGNLKIIISEQQRSNREGKGKSWQEKHVQQWPFVAHAADAHTCSFTVVTVNKVAANTELASNQTTVPRDRSLGASGHWPICNLVQYVFMFKDTLIYIIDSLTLNSVSSSITNACLKLNSPTYSLHKVHHSPQKH